jgi:threonine/homoserine/homoserine lactone efflux protein
MDYVILLRCFLIGVLASSSVGPIFILTFNRGAVYGFFRGFATGLGACIADGFYFFLGLYGVLAVLKESRDFMVVFDLIGGVALILLGIYSLGKLKKASDNVSLGTKPGIGFAVVKAFIITILNPLVFLFFMVIGAQILPEGVEFLTLRQMTFASVMVMLGSLSVLTMVSLISSLVGKSMNDRHLKIIYFITGIVFFGIGAYLIILAP